MLGELERSGGQACVLFPNSKDLLLRHGRQNAAVNASETYYGISHVHMLKLLKDLFGSQQGKCSLPFLLKRTKALPEPRLHGFVHYKGRISKENHTRMGLISLSMTAYQFGKSHS